MKGNYIMNHSKNLWKVVLIIIGIIASIILFSFIFVQTQINSAISLEQQIESSQSDINVQEKRRADLIPNLVECVKSYSEYEYNTLKDVIAERGADTDNAAQMINAVAEQYPQLKADTTYINLMNELSVTENLIAQFRSSYNNRVKDYNYYINSFPHTFTLPLGGYTAKTYEYLQYEHVSSDAPLVEFN